jgi:hypothetical protein
MGLKVSVFSTYKQPENRETNYTLLMLRMLYEESPRAFAGFVADLIGENSAEPLGIKFRQQISKASSVIDGEIRQDGFVLYIETKRKGEFNLPQLKNHLDALNKEHVQTKVLLALSANEDDPAFAQLSKLCSDQVQFVGLSYYDLLAVFEKQDVSSGIRATLAEFREFLQSQDLLSGWRNWLDVVNCARSCDVVEEGRAYFCPVLGGAYSHDRCRFFRMYRKKKVELIAEIRGVVDLDDETSAIVLWKNMDSDGVLIQEARDHLNRWLPGKYPRRVFVLGDGYPTEFIKDTKGGMMGSKRYFNVELLAATDAKDLAAKLNGKKWSDLG